MINLEPTEEQKLIIDCSGHRVVTANPGSGKTFTLSHIIKGVLNNLPSYKGVIAISYTNKASKELKDRCLGDGTDKKRSFFKTIDSFFISEIIFPYLPHFWEEQDELKIYSYRDELEIELDQELESLFKDLCSKISDNDKYSIDEYSEVLKFLFKNGIVLIETVGVLGNYVFDKSKACKKYLKARYSHVIVDEYQDSGLDQHEMFLKLKKLGLCSIAVGDVNQSIYGFAGKGSEYLASLLVDKSFEVFSLTRNMRCHKSISDYSLKLISSNLNITPSNEIRVFHRHVHGAEKEIAKWIDSNIDKVMKMFHLSNLNDVAILVRNDRTASTVSQSLGIKHKYLKTTILEKDSSPWANIFRDILYYKFLTGETKGNIVLDHIADIKKRDLAAISQILDELKTTESIYLKEKLELFINVAKLILPLEENKNVIKLLKDVLNDEELLNAFIPASKSEAQILTLHKSKGLEFKIVIHCDLVNYVIPGYQGTQGHKYSLSQDLNLHYVGITRAIEACILISTSHRTYSDGNIGKADHSLFLDYTGLRQLRHSK
ncbi:UvrD-helicase domain-containing protein [Halobacteriovorax sp. RT-2-4]|uniref:UvrD-helicase domain-containing protein n=1 Tax=unclassified Halobacteriovorax TaxID=2639665 RepID=UPI00399B1C47